MKWIIRIYSLILLAYCGWRTFDMMSRQLPDDATGQVLAVLFLFATEAGLILWHETSLAHCTTSQQAMIATAMIITDFVGSLAAGVGDMILNQTLASGYTIPPLLTVLLIYGMPLVVAANVAAVLYYLSNDADTLIEQGKRQLRYEVTRQALKELSDSRGAVAEGMKRDIARELRNSVTDRVTRELLRDPKPAPIASLAAPSPNGRKPVISLNAEVAQVKAAPLAESSPEEVNR